MTFGSRRGISDADVNPVNACITSINVGISPANTGIAPVIAVMMSTIRQTALKRAPRAGIIMNMPLTTCPGSIFPLLLWLVNLN